MARISGSSTTKEFIPQTKLVSNTKNPIGTIFAVWHGSRYKDEVDPNLIERLYLHDDPDNYNNELYCEFCDYLCSCYPEYCREGYQDYENVIKEVVRLAIKCDVPASEFVSIELCTNAASVAWREQMVRNRRIHPWLQTSRTADMTSYDCNMVGSIEMFGGSEAVDVYKNAVQVVRDAYDTLIKMGVPSEDIRLQTQGHIHRCYWGTSLRDLIKLVGKRVSWIAQSSLWLPINSDIISILRSMFGDIINEFVGMCEDATLNYDKDTGHYRVSNYKYDNENEDRYQDKDPQPCDPLWLAYKKRAMPEHTNIEMYDYMKSMYITMWCDEILDVLGWNRKYPKNLGPYDRPLSFWKDNDPKTYEYLTNLDKN